jgi:Transposase, Mutator family
VFTPSGPKEAESGAAARAACARFERTWAKRCPGIVHSLQEGGAELLTVFDFPYRLPSLARTTNVIERLNEEFRRRVKTQSALLGEDAALLLLYNLVATGQITLRKTRRSREDRRGHPRPSRVGRVRSVCYTRAGRCAQHFSTSKRDTNGVGTLLYYWRYWPWCRHRS